MNYTPKSAVAPQATIDVTISGVTNPTVTIPAYTNFVSEAVDGVNYNFVTTDTYTQNVVNGITFSVSETASVISIFYDTTNTGSDAILNYSVTKLA